MFPYCFKFFFTLSIFGALATICSSVSCHVAKLRNPLSVCNQSFLVEWNPHFFLALNSSVELANSWNVSSAPFKICSWLSVLMPALNSLQLYQKLIIIVPMLLQDKTLHFDVGTRYSLHRCLQYTFVQNLHNIELSIIASDLGRCPEFRTRCLEAGKLDLLLTACWMCQWFGGKGSYQR